MTIEEARQSMPRCTKLRNTVLDIEDKYSRMIVELARDEDKSEVAKVKKEIELLHEQHDAIDAAGREWSQEAERWRKSLQSLAGRSEPQDRGRYDDEVRTLIAMTQDDRPVLGANRFAERFKSHVTISDTDRILAYASLIESGQIKSNMEVEAELKRMSDEGELVRGEAIRELANEFDREVDGAQPYVEPSPLQKLYRIQKVDPKRIEAARQNDLIRKREEGRHVHRGRMM